MSVTANQNPIDWKKAFLVIAILAILGYQWYQNSSKSSPQHVTDSEAGDVGQTSTSVKSNPSKPESNRSATADAANREQSSKNFLQPAGGQNLKSPAGVIYGMGPRGEHRLEHVMLHTENNLSRDVHGVFEGDQDEILKLIDEAYEMIQKKSKHVKSEASQGNTAYTISMGRRIGYEGGEKGKRSKNQSLRSLKLILDGNRVITAYPCR